MPTKEPLTERHQTDESLRSERSETDRAIAGELTEVEASADELIERARVEADAVLEHARDQADAHQIGAAVTAAVVRARVVEDEALEAERAQADARIVREREEQRRAIALLLPLEREKTDRYLLTERVRSDDVLANRDDFMGMVSHDLRALLSGVVLEAEMLGHESAADAAGEKNAARAKRIQRYAARMNRLIGDLVDVVSIDAGKLAVTPVHADPAALVAQTLDAFAPAAAQKQVTLSARCADGLAAVFDTDRMMQVLANLIGNALKFTPPGGRIAVACERGPAGGVLLSVADSGSGLAADKLNAVFERFWQGKKDQAGLGLGLYISRCIVDAHGGRIWATSKAGEGATFHIELPAAQLPTR